jgi:hypothetical protein
VRLGQGDHPETPAARADFAGLAPAALAPILALARTARSAAPPANVERVTLLSAIVVALEAIGGVTRPTLPSRSRSVAEESLARHEARVEALVASGMSRERAEEQAGEEG